MSLQGMRVAIHSITADSARKSMSFAQIWESIVTLLGAEVVSEAELDAGSRELIY